MFDDSRAFVSRPFLQGELALEYKGYSDAEDSGLLDRLTAWDERLRLKETSAEGAFTQTFFVDTWGYGEAGRSARDSVTLIPKYPVAGAGAGGGAGEADLAMGWFGGNEGAIPQVLCEFKDIRSGLDAPQNRKGNSRSPVKQCLDYLKGAHRDLIGNEPVQPWWGLVTDMNEFRLYWWDRAPMQYLRFLVRNRGPRDLFADHDLLTRSPEARFDRFLFARLFHRDRLLSRAGRPSLLRLVDRQGAQDRKLEGDFYKDYRAVRERLFRVLLADNRSYAKTPARLLRLSQKLLDRFIFAFYCEDMGERMLFPPQMVRDYLQSRSRDPFYESTGSELWTFFKQLFSRMNTGGPLGQVTLPHINGGLFETDPEIDALNIPNHVFVAPGQWAKEGALQTDKESLFYLSGRYNFAASGSARESLSLYTLGRIFEQSITELEFRAGELEGRPSIAKLSKRKRDGVYYTPEPVVNLLVEETLSPWFAVAKSACGWPSETDGLPGRGHVEAYESRLRRLRLVDPACGSGAFLISAFRRLLDERIAVEGEKSRIRGNAAASIDEAALTADILANNIHGVDINPASVEITKLALWLHSARADAPLSSLDGTIRCGNSLVGGDFWRGRTPRAAEDGERVNAFDWRANFPEVWPDGAEGGFDIVVGNPPYVKLQNLIAVDPDVAAWLQADRGAESFESARTGNFDLYLPFIEQGLRLLAPGGRMAYIAPSLWTVNQYGEGLRRLVRRGRQLDRWIDFKAHQVFADVTTYTALQFFTREPNEAIRIAGARDGEAAGIDWTDEDLRVPYEAFPEDGEWLMATGTERALIDRLGATCPRLDDKSLTRGIIVGIQTSADAIFHLERVAAGAYRCRSAGAAPARVVDIEDAIMKPLISGAEAKRYEAPRSNTFLLFPYERTQTGAMRLLSETDLNGRFPRAWAYLRSWEVELRARESGKMNHSGWWAYNYPKNLDKQDLTKLVVPRLVEHLKASLDNRGVAFLDNVDVGGVIAAADVDPAYLLAVVNGPVADYVFRRIAKPFRGDYRSANKQFIAPLPVPAVTGDEQAIIGSMARDLQALWTSRRETLGAAADRLSVLGRARHGERWLWPDLESFDALEERTPRALRLAAERRDWALKQLDEEIAVRLGALQARLDGGRLEVRFDDGELRLFANGVAALSRIYLSPADGVLTAAYWRWILLTQLPRDAGPFAAELRRPPMGAESAAADQFIAKVDELAGEIEAIASAERAMNLRLYDLYGLTGDERLLVEKDQIRRNGAANHP